MFCPQCGQSKTSDNTNFCSRCGFLLTGAADLLKTGGILPSQTANATYQPPSPRSKGIKQGVFIFLLSFLIVPLIIIFLIVVQFRTPAPAIVAAIILGVGGLLRMAYAWMFESPVPSQSWTENQKGVDLNLRERSANLSLPPQQTYPASSFVAPTAGRWQDTNDLLPTSVTEGTTKLFEKDDV